MYFDEIIQVITAFFGTLGFGFLFNIRGMKLLLASLGGMIAWIIFLAMGLATNNEVLRYFIVSIIMTLYAEVLARIMKTPSTTFCIVTLLPLIPGGALYYTMSNAVSGDLAAFLDKAIYTVQLAAALSLGIVLVTAGSRYAAKHGRKTK